MKEKKVMEKKRAQGTHSMSNVSGWLRSIEGKEPIIYDCIYYQ